MKACKTCPFSKLCPSGLLADLPDGDRDAARQIIIGGIEEAGRGERMGCHAVKGRRCVGAGAFRRRDSTISFLSGDEKIAHHMGNPSAPGPGRDEDQGRRPIA